MTTSLLFIVWTAGCNTGVSSSSDGACGGSAAGLVDGNVSCDPATVGSRHVCGEPDDSFVEALDIVLDASGAGQIQGTISTISDVDIFNLGSLSAGDRVQVDFRGSGGLDADIAVFDAADRLFIDNDDRSDTDVNPLIDEIIRHDGGNYYLAVAGSPFASPGAQTGTYTAAIQITRGQGPPAPVAQAVLLNFAGGSIAIPGLGTVAVPPFDTGDIDPLYAGQTGPVKRAIIQTVRSDYQGIGLTVYDTDTHPAPAGVALSTIFFGSADRTALGISQEVDAYNHNPTDESLIFTDDFSPAQFGLALTPAELGHAIGNVASHEIGHLVGLNHVDNTTDIMDTTGGPSTLLDAQTFQSSPLDATIFPFGMQDEPLLLAEILGLSP